MARRLAALLGLCSLLLLSGCGLVSLGYPRLPDLGLLWMERQVSLNADQAQQWRRDLQDVLAWHRRTQLRPTADLLQRWQALASTEFSAEEVCREADTVRRLVEASAPQLLPGLVRLARSLDAEQRQAVAHSQAKSLAEFRETHLGDRNPWGGWLPGAQAGLPTEADRQAPNADPSVAPTEPAAPSPKAAKVTAAALAASLDKRMDQATDRYETLYGRLNRAQVLALRGALERSNFDAQRLLAERERRSQDLLQALADTASAAPGAESGPLSGWLVRLQASPTPGHMAYTRRLQEEGCAQMATLHRLATPAQRQKAVTTLAGYEADLRRLAQP